MTQPDNWERIFEEVHKVPGSGNQQPAKKTLQAIEEETNRVRRRYAADVAVSLGGTETGEDWDPFGWLFDWSTGIFDQFTNLDDSVTANTEAIAVLEEIAAAVNTTPAYVSDVDNMATIPRGMVSVTGFHNTTLSRPKYQDFLTYLDLTNSANRYAYFGVPPVFKPKVVTGTSKGHIYYTPIVVDRTGTVGEMRWIAGADTSVFSINYYEVALCVYNPATGDLEKVWGSGNIKDAEADTTTIGEVVIDMGISQTCEPGQILFAAHQQTAPGGLQVPRRFAAVPEPPLARTVPLLDAWCFVAEDYTQGIPSAIDFASLTRENRFVPWMSVSVSA